MPTSLKLIKKVLFKVFITLTLDQLMSARLNQISSHLQEQKPTRIVQFRNQYPLARNEVRDLIYGAKYRQVVDKCFDVMIDNKHIYQHPDIEDYERPQERKKVAEMVLTYHKLRPENTLDIEKDQHLISVTSHATYQFEPSLSVRCDITVFLYTKTIISFARRGFPQHQKFIHNGLIAKDIGCFGLTQIGHGSDTKNLQTEAVYDHETRSFTLNSPSQTAFKFWIGGAAEIANKALIWAQLVIKGKKYGIHPFIVPLRDRKTMKAYSGVLVGDCGSKFGLHGIDNGYIGFVNYKIPFENLLDRVSGVDSAGNFRSIEQNPQRRHGLYMAPLSLGRAFITFNCIGFTFNALNIGLKYACMRRQFQASNKKEEQLIIDYSLVRFRLMPMIAQAFVFFVVGSHIVKQFDHNSKQILKGKSKLADELHAISASAKARVSWFAIETIGSIRHLLGGHGYSSYSRLGRMYFDQDVNTTWEGDNNMLLQQTSKYVLKEIQKRRQKPDPSSLLNFANEEITLPEKWTKEDLLSLANIKKIYQQRLLEVNDELVNYMMELKGNNMTHMDVWNRSQCYFGKKISFLYNDLYYINVFEKKISQLPEGPLKEVALNSLRLWVCFDLERNRWASLEERKILQEIVQQLCEWLTPRSVSLVEACSSPQEIIGSPFADRDGDKMWDKYLALLYSTKDVFGRVPYYQDIIDGRRS